MLRISEGRMKRFLLFLSIFNAAICEAAVVDLTNTSWEKHAKQCNLDPLLLYAIALKESSHITGDKSFVAPHRYALNNPIMGSYYPVNRDDAVRKVREYVSVSALTDIGITQINWRWNGSNYVSDPAELLDVDKNIEVSAKVLCRAIELSPNDIAQAIGNYHTPNPALKNKAKEYGESVLLIWKRLKENEQ